MNSRVRVCKDLLVGVPAQLHAASDNSARVLAIAERAHRMTTLFASNGSRQDMMGPGVDRLNNQDNRIRNLSLVSQRLAFKNADLEATMKQVTSMLIKLLQEPKQSAAPPLVQVGLPRVEFEAYISQASYK